MPGRVTKGHASSGDFKSDINIIIMKSRKIHVNNLLCNILMSAKIEKLKTLHLMTHMENDHLY